VKLHLTLVISRLSRIPRTNVTTGIRAYQGESHH